MHAFLWTQLYGPVLSGDVPFILDFSFFYRAAERFAADPLALYGKSVGGFIYPPLSVLVFLPLLLVSEPVAFILWEGVLLGLAVLNIWLILRLYERATRQSPGRSESALLLLIGLALAPVLQDLKVGQATMPVLASGLGFLYLLERGRPFWAGVVLSLGFWLKLYPLVLAPLGVQREAWKPYLTGFAVGLIGLPVATLPFIPLDLYAHYVSEVVPHLTGTTAPYGMNASIAGIVARLELPLSAALQGDRIPVAGLTKGVSGALLLGVLGGCLAGVAAGRMAREVAGFCILAAVPVTSQLGWEYTYVLALPLVLFVLMEARGRGVRVEGIVGLGLLALLVPKPPDEVMAVLFTWWPRPLIDLFYARFALAVSFFIALTAWWTWRAARTNAAPGGRATAVIR